MDSYGYHFRGPTKVVISRQNMRLTELNPYPNVQVLKCWNNRLTSVPMYQTLEDLKCGNVCPRDEQRPGYLWGNHLPKLPDFPSLEKLHCGNVGPTQLPNCPHLEYLDCSDNKLTEIPPYNWLTALYCGNAVGGSNQIRELTMYPLLRVLNCPNAGIESLPLYPKLGTIDLTGNPIAEMMEDPTSIVEYRRMATPRAKSARSATDY